jgi:hypothetical protein
VTPVIRFEHTIGAGHDAHETAGTFGFIVQDVACFWVFAHGAGHASVDTFWQITMPAKNGRTDSFVTHDHAIAAFFAVVRHRTSRDTRQATDTLAAININSFHKSHLLKLFN